LETYTLFSNTVRHTVTQ